MDSNPPLPGKLDDNARRTQPETEFRQRGKRTEDALIKLLQLLVDEGELGLVPAPALISEVMDPPPDRFALQPLAWPGLLSDGFEGPPPLLLLLAAVPV